MFNKKENFSLAPGIEINYTIKIDTIFQRPKEKNESIIFRNNKYLVWSHDTHTTQQGPYSIGNHSWFKDLPKTFRKGVDAVIARPTDPERELIIFKDNQWILWSYANDQLSMGPYNISQHPWFAALPKSFHSKIDCIIPNPDTRNYANHLFFFSGEMVVRFDFKLNKLVGNADPISKHYLFKFLPGLFKNSIDGGRLIYRNGRFPNILIFKADEYLEYSHNYKRIVAGPNKILSHPYWKQLGVHFIESKSDPNIQKYMTLDKSGKGHHGILHDIKNVANLPFSNNFQKNANDMYKLGKSVRFNGSSSFMEMNSIKDLYKSGFTFCLFFMISNFNNIPEQEMFLAHSRGDLEWELYIKKNRHLCFRIKKKDGMWSSLFSEEKIKPKWYHVAISQDNNEQKLHMNQIEIKKNNPMLGFPNDLSNIIIGTGGYAPNYENYFDGVIGDIRIFNSVISRKEICNISNKCPNMNLNIGNNVKETIKQNLEKLKQCEFRPKGLREIDCFKLCKSEKSLNNCSTDECLQKCAECKDETNCKWLIPPEIIVKPEQKVDPVKINECQFNPYGINRTFCVNTCMGEEKNLWGGDNCTEKKCDLLCRGCKNPDVCNWLAEPIKYKETTPDRPILDAIAGNEEVILYWERPKDGNTPMDKYVILIYETLNTKKGITVDFAVDPKCTNCSHIVKNLKNDVKYSFGVSAVNKKGMSKISNIAIATPKSTNKLEKFEDYTINSETDLDSQLYYGNQKVYNGINKNVKNGVYSANGTMTQNLLNQLIGKTINITI